MNFIDYKETKSHSSVYLHRKDNMAEILKFIYVMIIFLFLFLVRTGVGGK